MVEHTYGAFSRMMRLPAPVAADKIKATYKKGVLTVTWARLTSAVAATSDGCGGARRPGCPLG